MMGLILLMLATAAQDFENPATLASRWGRLYGECRTRWIACAPQELDEHDRAEWRGIREKQARIRAEFAPQYLAIAAENPLGEIGQSALVEILMMEDRTLSPEGAMALQILRLEYAGEPAIGKDLGRLATCPWEGLEWLLDDVIERNPDYRTRCQALFARAQRIDRRARVATERRQNTQSRKDRELYGEDQWQRLIRLDPQAEVARARPFYERLQRENPVGLDLPDQRRTVTQKLARGAVGWLRDHNSPSIDRPAPEIDGPTVQGPRLRLSDYRGKVVLLLFWTSQSVASRATWQGSRNLRKEYSEQPFVILGVQCETPADRALATLMPDSFETLSWIDTEGDPKSIARRYGVTEFPSSFLIDDEGILVTKRPYQIATFEDVLLQLNLRRDRLDAGPPRP